MKTPNFKLFTLVILGTSLVCFHSQPSHANSQCEDLLQIKYEAPENIRNKFMGFQQALNQSVLHQTNAVERLIMALIIDGHVLVEGDQGTGKTRLIRKFAELSGLKTKKDHFNAETRPSQITGYYSLNPLTQKMEFHEGLVATDILNIDEINRGTPKTQAALFEPMENRNYHVNGEEKQASEFFMTIASQNPSSQEGTFNLPEAQYSRFLFSLHIQYSDKESEADILNLMLAEKLQGKSNNHVSPLVTKSDIRQARSLILKQQIPATVKNYALSIIDATRNISQYLPQYSDSIRISVSPRGTLNLILAAQARSWLQGRSSVSQEDIDQVAHDVLRHQIFLKSSALNRGLTTDKIIDAILEVLKNH